MWSTATIGGGGMTDQTDEARFENAEDVEAHRRLRTEMDEPGDDARLGDTAEDDDTEAHMKIRHDPAL
jgi:hypothetical protein